MEWMPLAVVAARATIWPPKAEACIAGDDLCLVADARTGLDAFIRLLPGNLADQLAARPFRRPADRERYLAGVRKAGLPEI